MWTSYVQSKKNQKLDLKEGFSYLTYVDGSFGQKIKLPLSLTMMEELLKFHCITFLIEQKAEVNARDRQNNTPLHILRKKHNLEQNSCLSIAEELIKAGADLTAVNNKGKTPMDNEHVQQLREEKPELFQKIK